MDGGKFKFECFLSEASFILKIFFFLPQITFAKVPDSIRMMYVQRGIKLFASVHSHPAML
jgi:hypothetical protein